MVGATPPALGLVAGRGAGTSDPEGEYERWFFEQPPPPQLEAGPQVSRRRGEKEPRHNEGVLSVWSGSGAPRILPNKCDRPDVGAPAAILEADAWGRC